MQHRLNQDTYARVFALLMHDPVSAKEIVEETGLHRTTAQSLMRCFKKYKLVHIVAWETDGMGRDVSPVYKFGKGKDIPRRKMTSAERQQRCKAKKLHLQTLLFKGQ